MPEFSRRVDIHVFKDEPITLAEYARLQPATVTVDAATAAYADLLEQFQPYRWHAVAMNNKIISDGENYYNLADLEETLELFAGDDTTVYAMHMFGEHRGEVLLRYGKTDRDAQAAQS